MSLSPKHIKVQWRSVLLGVFLVLGSIAIVGWIFVGSGYFLLETYFVPNPYIDTQFSEEFTWEAWGKIEPGMSKEEARQLLGMPLQEAYGPYGGYFGIKSGENYSRGICDSYSTDDASLLLDFAWIDMRVCYNEHDYVLGKAEIILYD